MKSKQNPATPETPAEAIPNAEIIPLSEVPDPRAAFLGRASIVPSIPNWDVIESELEKGLPSDQGLKLELPQDRTVDQMVPAMTRYLEKKNLPYVVRNAKSVDAKHIYICPKPSEKTVENPESGHPQQRLLRRAS